MTLTIVPNKFTQPDFTVFYTAPDGRKLPDGRIFKATAAPKETPWFWSVEFLQRRRCSLRIGRRSRPDATLAAWIGLVLKQHSTFRWPHIFWNGANIVID